MYKISVQTRFTNLTNLNQQQKLVSEDEVGLPKINEQ